MSPDSSGLTPALTGGRLLVVGSRMDMKLRELGDTGPLVTPICIGISPLASMPGVYGYAVGAERAEGACAGSTGG